MNEQEFKLFQRLAVFFDLPHVGDNAIIKAYTSELAGEKMYIADLHIHSRFSRATSRDLDAAQLDLWARRKGISLVGTGDFTHPAWREELKEMLEETDGSVYRLRREHVLECEAQADEPR